MWRTATRFTHEYGDIDERFYRSVESALEELAALLRGEARELYPPFSDRLASVEQMSDSIGWGFHDFIADVVWRLEEELGGPGLARGRLTAPGAKPNPLRTDHPARVFPLPGRKQQPRGPRIFRRRRAKSAKSSIHGHYLSPKDIAICAACDLAPHATHANYPAIEAIHEHVRAAFAEPKSVQPAGPDPV